MKKHQNTSSVTGIQPSAYTAQCLLQEAWLQNSVLFLVWESGSFNRYYIGIGKWCEKIQTQSVIASVLVSGIKSYTMHAGQCISIPTHNALLQYL